MIHAVFRRQGDSFRGVEVSGHAGFADYGSDIVCASVTSALQMAANGITEVLCVPAQVQQEENRISFLLPAGHSQADLFLKALHLHLNVLTEQYSDYLTVTVLEV